MNPRWRTAVANGAANPRILLQSAWCILRLRLRGVSGFVTNDGRQPVLYTAGHCSFGRVALRGRTARVEIGALRGATLVVADGVSINQGATIVASVEIRIGDGCQIGDFVAVYDTDYHPVDQQHATRSAPVLIGRNVWLGRGAMILPGVTIGDHAVVAAGAVVPRDVPPKVLVAGNPARVIRELTIAEEGWRRT